MRRTLLLLAFTGTLSAQKVVPPAVPTGSITGRVICSDTQRPARFADVFVVPKSDPATSDLLKKRDANTTVLYGAQTSTGLDGSFTIDNLPPGEYFLVPHLTGYVVPIALDAEHGRAGQQWSEASVEKVLANFTTVTVSAARSSSVELSLDRGAVLSGRVLFDDGTPMAGQAVRVAAAEGNDPFSQNLGHVFSGMYSFGRNTQTDDAGRFRIAGIPPGKYVVYVLFQGELQRLDAGTGAQPYSRTSFRGQFIQVFAPDAFRQTDARVIEIKGAEVQNDDDITLDFGKLHTVSGHVLSAEDQHAIASGYVQIREQGSEDGFARFGTLLPDGSFRVAFVPEGNYNLTISNAGDPKTVAPGEQPELSRSYSNRKQAVIVADHDVILPDVLLRPAKSVPSPK